MWSMASRVVRWLVVVTAVAVIGIAGVSRAVWYTCAVEQVTRAECCCPADEPEPPSPWTPASFTAECCATEVTATPPTRVASEAPAPAAAPPVVIVLVAVAPAPPQVELPPLATERPVAPPPRTLQQATQVWLI